MRRCVPFALEAIGDDLYQACRERGWRRLPDRLFNEILVKRMGRVLLTGERRPPWRVDELVAVAGEDFVRESVRGQRDWSQANGMGSRGIYIRFLLQEDRIYEIHGLAAYGAPFVRYIRVADGETRPLSREQALCLL